MYDLMISDCLMKGIGIKQDTDEALFVLQAHSDPTTNSRLLFLYGGNEYLEPNPERLLLTICKYVNQGFINPFLIDKLKNIKDKVEGFNLETSFNEYNGNIIEKLIWESKKTDNIGYKIRCLDAARKLGSVNAAEMEAKVLINQFHDKKLAFSIMKKSGVDAASEAYRSINPSEQVIIDVDRTVKKYFRAFQAYLM